MGFFRIQAVLHGAADQSGGVDGGG
jgi:hypothetical protein